MSSPRAPFVNSPSQQEYIQQKINIFKKGHKALIAKDLLMLSIVLGGFFALLKEEAKPVTTILAILGIGFLFKNFHDKRQLEFKEHVDRLNELLSIYQWCAEEGYTCTEKRIVIDLVKTIAPLMNESQVQKLLPWEQSSNAINPYVLPSIAFTKTLGQAPHFMVFPKASRLSLNDRFNKGEITKAARELQKEKFWAFHAVFAYFNLMMYGDHPSIFLMNFADAESFSLESKKQPEITEIKVSSPSITTHAAASMTSSQNISHQASSRGSAISTDTHVSPLKRRFNIFSRRNTQTLSQSAQQSTRVSSDKKHVPQRPSTKVQSRPASPCFIEKMNQRVSNIQATSDLVEKAALLESFSGDLYKEVERQSKKNAFT